MTLDIRAGVPLAPLTTLRVGGPAREFVTVESEADLIEAVAEADSQGIPVLVLAGGSNVVVADEGFDGRVIHVRTTGVDPDVTDCYGAWVRVAAGESWDSLVARAVAEEWVGIEALSGIPGSVGATPVQNVGAYGQEVAGTIARVEVFDRQLGQRAVLAATDCDFGYRTSRFKGSSRYVILAVSYQFKRGDLSAPIGYAELARSLGVEARARAPMVDVRDAVLQLRSSKGMVLEESDHDTWSAGSFFTNPVLPLDVIVPDGAPHWRTPHGIKVSAAWLIENAGFTKGFHLAGSQAALSSKHTLALTNRGAATTAELLNLARAVRNGVADTFGITLRAEPSLVGCAF